MKKIVIITAIILFTGTFAFVSCLKEHSCEGCRGDTNRPPIAKAGPDHIITLPTDSVLLDGTASSDPDGKINGWLWSKIEGPASFFIDSPTTAKTKVKNLKVGTYRFVLTVTDNGGLSAKDTLGVIVDSATPTNRPPIANAGPDQIITLPANTATLDGSGSTDPDNDIASYQWTKISGPSSFGIANTNAVQTQINNLVQGNYQFELTVTDNGGLFSKDTVLVIANSPITLACFQLFPFNTLPFSGYDYQATFAGNKILFVAPNITTSATASCAYIYDTMTRIWSVHNLSLERFNCAVTNSGNKVFIAGGDEGYGYGFVYSRVDIYDAVTDTWSTAELSRARTNLAAASLNGRVYFAGGWSYDDGVFDLVDVYDVATNSWSTDHLSLARSGLSAVSLNNKIYFAGGGTGGSYSDRVDIYDASINAWSTITMAEAKYHMACIAGENKIIWAGGENSIGFSDLADVYDVSSGTHTLHHMGGIPESFYNNCAVRMSNKLIFLMSSNDDFKIEIYDLSSEGWTNCELVNQPNPNITFNVGNRVFAAGGWQNGSYLNTFPEIRF